MSSDNEVQESIVYTPLKDIKVGETINLIGIITRIGDVRTTKKKDLYISMTIIDLSLNTGEERTIMFFRKHQNQFPKNREVGNLIVARFIKSQSYRKDEPQLLSLLNSRINIYPPDQLEDTAIEEGLKVKLLELREWFKSMSKPSPIQSSSSNADLNDINNEDDGKSNSEDNGKSFINVNDYMKSYNLKKLKTLEHFHPFKYFDLVAMVIEIKLDNGSNEMLLILSDFTENELLSSKEFTINEKKIDKPMFILCTLWDEHSRFCRENVKKGDILLMRNLRCKFGARKTLELALHTEHKKVTDKICILDYNHELSAVLLERMNALISSAPSTKVNKRKAEDELDLIEVEYPSLPITSISTVIKEQSTILKDKKYPEPYHIKAKIVNLSPDFEKFVNFYCFHCGYEELTEDSKECGKCKLSKKEAGWFIKYKFVLHLKDLLDDSLFVLVTGKEAERFFNFVSPKEFYFNSSSRLKLKNRLIQLCNGYFNYNVLAFKSKDKEDLNYALFGTRIC